MNVDRTDLLQLNKELDKHTRNPIVLGCPKSRSASSSCVAHENILRVYNALGITALLFFNKSDFFSERKTFTNNTVVIKAWHGMDSY